MSALWENITPEQWLIVGLALVLVMLSIWLGKLEARLKRLAMGSSGQNLEKTIAKIAEELNRAIVYRQHLDQYLKEVEGRLRRSLKTAGTVRFNPFPDKGGNQSFASAFLDEEGNGVVISTLSAREKINIYAKPLKNFNSEFQLTDEERKAIEQARQ